MSCHVPFETSVSHDCLLIRPSFRVSIRCEKFHFPDTSFLKFAEIVYASGWTNKSQPINTFFRKEASRIYIFYFRKKIFNIIMYSLLHLLQEKDIHDYIFVAYSVGNIVSFLHNIFISLRSFQVLLKEIREHCTSALFTDGILT